jgi:hypothetical protein
MQLTQASKHCLGVSARPTSTGTFHPMVDNGFDATFDRATPHGKTLLPESSLLHFRLARVEVCRGLVNEITDLFPRQVELLEGLDDKLGISCPKMV